MFTYLQTTAKFRAIILHTHFLGVTTWWTAGTVAFWLKAMEYLELCNIRFYWRQYLSTRAVRNWKLLLAGVGWGSNNFRHFFYGITRISWCLWDRFVIFQWHLSVCQQEALILSCTETGKKEHPTFRLEESYRKEVPTQERPDGKDWSGKRAHPPHVGNGLLDLPPPIPHPQQKEQRRGCGR